MTIGLNAENLDNGTFEASIKLATNDPENDTLVVPVTLSVQDIALVVSADKDSICYESSTRLHAEVIGGSGNATYSWTSDPAGFSSDEPDPIVNPETTTTYFVEITDGAVSLSDQVTITVIPLPEIDLGPDDSFCEGTSYIIDAGPDYTTYFWSNGETTQTIEVTGSGTYWCLVSNEFGCSERDSIQLTVNPLPDVDLGDDYSFCENTITVLDAGEGFSSYLWNTGEDTRTIEISQAGEYWVEVTSDELCQNSDTIFLITDPLPQQASITGGPSEVDLYATTASTFTSSEASNAENYSWTIDPSEAATITGNGTTAEVTWNEEFTGVAELMVIPENGCGQGPVSESYLVTVYSSLSVDEIAGIGSIEVFPNPTRGTISLNMKSNREIQASLKITDMNGRIVYSDLLELRPGINSEKISLSDNRDGIYTLTINAENGVIEKKIILKK
jgi:hypothetical protein